MWDTLPSPDSAILIAMVISDLVRRIDPFVLPYLAAALVTAFWHRHMWAVYLALAVFVQLGWHY